MSLQSTGMRFTTPSGLMAGGATSNYFASPSFKNRVRDPKNECSSPDAVVLCKDAAQSLYCHLLCALSDSTSIVMLYSFFACELKSIT
jgi:auxin responsive GH3 family protein